MKNNLSFEIPIYTVANSVLPKPISGNYDYWLPLLSIFLEKADSVEIHCWNEEANTIEEISSLFSNALTIRFDGDVSIFKGTKTSTLTDYIQKHHMNKKGEFKWFTVNLLKELTLMFHSGHWGTEFFVPAVSHKEIAFIKSVSPTGTNFYEFQ